MSTTSDEQQQQQLCNREERRDVLLHAHTLTHPGHTRVRVELWNTSDVDYSYILVEHFQGPEHDAARLPGGGRIDLGGCTTEFIAETYAEFMKQLAPGQTFNEEDFVTPHPSSNHVLSIQPIRKADTSIEVIRPYFKMPINEASKQLGICSTSLKKICRTHGLQRWPYRKVKSMKLKVLSLGKAELVPQPISPAHPELSPHDPHQSLRRSMLPPPPPPQLATPISGGHSSVMPLSATTVLSACQQPLIPGNGHEKVDDGLTLPMPKPHRLNTQLSPSVALSTTPAICQGMQSATEQVRAAPVQLLPLPALPAPVPPSDAANNVQLLFGSHLCSPRMSFGLDTFMQLEGLGLDAVAA